MVSIAQDHRVDLGAIAIQFLTRQPQVSVVIPGAASVRELTQLCQWISCEIPDETWRDVNAARRRSGRPADDDATTYHRFALPRRRSSSERRSPMAEGDGAPTIDVVMTTIGDGTALRSMLRCSTRLTSRSVSRFG